MQSLYGEILKGADGVQKAAELIVFNGLVARGVLGLGLEFVVSRLSLNSSNNLIGTVDETLRPLSPGERLLANVLTREGYNVQAIPESTILNKREADVLITNLNDLSSLKVEFKSLEPGASSNTLKDAVNKPLKGEGQARNIIIDARGSGLTEEEATRSLNRVGGITRGKLDQLRIIGDNFDLSYKYTP
jgi:hypothetical protein